MAILTFLYGLETWTINASERSKMQVSKIKCLRIAKKCTKINHLNNDSMRSDFKIRNIYSIGYKKIEKIRTDYQENYKI